MRKKRNRTHSTSQDLQRRARRIGTLAACFVVIAGCSPDGGLLSSSSPVGNVDIQLKTVNVAKVSKQQIGEIPEIAADLQAATQVDIILKAGGTISEVLKKRGDTVKKGEVILRLTSSDLVVQRERAALSVISLAQAIDRIKRDSATNKMEITNTISKLEADLASQTKQYNKMRNDYDAGVATKAQLEQAQIQLVGIQMDIKLQKQRQSSLSDSTVELTNMELQLKDAQEKVQATEKTLQALEIRATIDGVLAELKAEEGLVVDVGGRVGHIIHIDKLLVKTQINEEVAKLVRGKTELTLLDPLTNRKLKGRISYLSTFLSTETKGYE